jgi:hypothetical protein
MMRNTEQMPYAPDARLATNRSRSGTPNQLSRKSSRIASEAIQQNDNSSADGKYAGIRSSQHRGHQTARSSLSIVSLQLLIKLTGSLTVSKAVFRNFVQFSSLEVVSDILAVDIGLRRGNAEDFAEEFEGTLSVTIKVR